MKKFGKLEFFIWLRVDIVNLEVFTICVFCAINNFKRMNVNINMDGKYNMDKHMNIPKPSFSFKIVLFY